MFDSLTSRQEGRCEGRASQKRWLCSFSSANLGTWATHILGVCLDESSLRDKATRGSVSVSTTYFPSSLLRNRASTGSTSALWHAGTGSRGNSVLMPGVLVAGAIVSQPPTYGLVEVGSGWRPGACRYGVTIRTPLAPSPRSRLMRKMP